MAVVSALAAIVQSVFAAHVGSYAASADRLARATIEPAFEAGVSRKNELVMENAGRDPITDVIVSQTMVTITNGKACGARTGTIPAAPGEKREWFWTIPRLNPGETQRKPLMPVLEDGIKLEKEVRDIASKGGLTCEVQRDPFVFTVLALRITYRREADGRRFTRLIRVVPRQAENTGTIVAHQDGGLYWQHFREAIESVKPDL